MLKEWWNSIPVTNIAPIKELVDGDDGKSNKYVTEVMETAKKEGWILNPQWANPGAQDFVEPDQQDEMLNFIKNNE